MRGFREQMERMAEGIRKSLEPMQAQQAIVSRLAKQIEANRKAVLEPILRTAAAIREAWIEGMPANLRELEFESLWRALEVTSESGPCLVWAPRAAIVQELVDQKSFDDRAAVLIAHRDEVLDDAEALLADSTVTVIPEQDEIRGFVEEAIAAARDGHDQAAQALLAAALSHVIHGARGFEKFKDAYNAMSHDVEKTALRFARPVHIEMATVNAITNTYSDPEGFNRHGSLHGDPAFYGEAEMLAGVLLVSAWVRELSWWAENDPSFFQ